MEVLQKHMPKGITLNFEGAEYSTLRSLIITEDSHQYKLSKFLKKHTTCTNPSKSEIEEFKAFLTFDAYELSFEFRSPSEIPSTYCEELSYDVGHSSSLAKSCMNRKPENFFELYEEHAKGILVLLDDSECLLGRALVWDAIIEHTGETITFLDRIYTGEDCYEILFKNYAIERDWAYKENQNFRDDTSVVMPSHNGYILFPVKLSVRVSSEDLYGLNFVPYCDTFKYVTHNRLISFPGAYVNSLEKTYHHYEDILNGIDGVSSEYRYGHVQYECGECGWVLDEDEVYFASDGGVYCANCFNNHYFHCYSCSSEGDIDHAYCVDGEHYCYDCFSEQFFTCEICEEIFDIDDLHKDTSESNICRSCYHDHYSTCYHCGKVVEREVVRVSPGNFHHYCSDCFEDTFSECDRCKELEYNSDLELVGDEYCCRNCVGVIAA